MAEFSTPELQSLKQSFSFTDLMDPNMELMGQYSASNPSVLDNNNNNNQSIMSFQSSFLPFSNEIFFTQQTPSEFENFPLLGSNLPTPGEFQDMKKRKSIDVVSESCSGISTPQVSETGFKRKNSTGRGKRMKNIEKEEEKSTREVVHVRARRGQATDSHSLAERVRRGKINERLKCLKDIVPGCYKTMGMAVMLDEIINYVQSLQNQVEFLSMKLAAASNFYDFNTEADAISKLQRAKAHEAKELERLMKSEGYEGFASFHSTLPL